MKKALCLLTVLAVAATFTGCNSSCDNNSSSDNTTPTPTTINSSLTTSSYQLGDGSYAEAWVGFANVTGTATFTMSASSMNSYPFIIDGVTGAGWESDNAGPGQPETITFPTVKDHYYLLVASGYPNEVGNFTITQSKEVWKLEHINLKDTASTALRQMLQKKR